MNWEKELIELFDDSLLADVRPLPPRVTGDDRLKASFVEINDWIADNGREPCENSDNFKEKILFRRLKSLREDEEKCNYLKELDVNNLL